MGRYRAIKALLCKDGIGVVLRDGFRRCCCRTEEMMSVMGGENDGKRQVCGEAMIKACIPIGCVVSTCNRCRSYSSLEETSIAEDREVREGHC